MHTTLFLPLVTAALLAMGTATPSVGTSASSSPWDGQAMTASAPADTAGRWRWPVAPPRMLAAYRQPEHDYAAGHRGVDLAAPGQVTSPAAGVVHFRGSVAGRPVLSIDHGGGYLSSFDPLDSRLAKGDSVTAGQVVGSVPADAAHCGAGCVHFGVRLNGKYISPLLMLGPLPRSVLLPWD